MGRHTIIRQDYHTALHKEQREQKEILEKLDGLVFEFDPSFAQGPKGIVVSEKDGVRRLAFDYELSTLAKIKKLQMEEVEEYVKANSPITFDKSTLKGTKGQTQTV
jgi:hypothetical protein